MTLRVSSRVQPTEVAVLLSVALHLFVLVVFAPFGTGARMVANRDQQALPPLIAVRLLAEPLVAPGHMAIKGVSPLPAAASPSSVDKVRPRLDPASPQTKLPTPNDPVFAETHPIDAAAQLDRKGVSPTALSHATAELIASPTEPSRSEGRPNQVNDPAAERPLDQKPSQEARPDYAYSPQPIYPMLLREQGVGGVVLLRVWVDSDGWPGEVNLAKGSGYRLLDDAALRAVKQWRFIPAKNGEQTLASWVEFPIRFTLNG